MPEFAKTLEAESQMRTHYKFVTTSTAFSVEEKEKVADLYCALRTACLEDEVSALLKLGPKQNR